MKKALKITAITATIKLQDKNRNWQKSSKKYHSK
jgi:hypothetical protein